MDHHMKKKNPRNKLNLQEILKETERFGYTPETVHRFHSLLQKVLAKVIKHSNSDLIFLLSLEFTSDQILAYIMDDNGVFSSLVKPTAPLYYPSEIAKADDFEISITKIGRGEDPSKEKHPKYTTNVLSIYVDAKQKSFPMEKYHSSWNILLHRGFGGQVSKEKANSPIT